MNQKKRRQGVGMLLLFTLVVFCAMIIHVAVSGIITYLLVRFGLITVSAEAVPDTGKLIVFLALISLPIGMILAIIASKFPLKPIRSLVDGMNRLASGDFKARVDAGAVMRRYPAVVEVAESFNKMAQELESTEMLRSDFINNFSHEFKTPIVSIAGYAKLLNRGGLTPEQQREYLRIIEEESLRLSNMATNVLHLTKVENQTILTDVTEYNLSEQIRASILLLESKWDKKGLELLLDFGEHRIRANEELLKQVWLNLLDNAIKFAPEGHTVQVQIAEVGNSLEVSVMNTGSQILPEQQKKIWNKFYQADESHATQGNGIGLAIVRRIVELHGGRVGVRSENDVTVFTVTLPIDPK